jgi:hypothetical protein
MYVSIRYKDGTILPIYLFVQNFKEHSDWQRECVIVPYYKPIENIVGTMRI